jgi:sulfopyruvate decarboxylase subunit beta
MRRIDVLQKLYSYTEDIPVISACGSTSREWASLGWRPNHLYNVDTMGLVPSIALGVSLAIENSPIKKCIAIEGDGGLLMNPNVLGTMSYLNPKNLVLIILDNGCFGSTGGQASLASKLDLVKIIEGHELKVASVNTVEGFERTLQNALETTNEAQVIHVKIEIGDIESKFLNEDPSVASYQFTQFIKESFNNK